MAVAKLGVLLLITGALASASIPYTGRSQYGMITTTLTPTDCAPADCLAESFPSTNSSDTVFAYQVIGLSNFSLEINNTSPAAMLDANQEFPFGAFITDEQSGETNFYGATPGSRDSCSYNGPDLPSITDCSVMKSTGFDIVFTVKDGNANCHDPSGNCGFVFFVGETSAIQPTATLTANANTPEPAGFGLAAVGLAIAGLQLVSVRRRRQPKDENF